MSSKRKVLLIGWDAADWEHINPLLEAGLMPTLDQMINEGVMGNLATLEPILSPMLWNSVATGMLPEKHGILGFIEPDPVNGGVRPYTSTSRKVKALWNILTQSGLKSNIIGWWASHPAEPIDGCIVTNHFTGIKFVPNKGWQVADGNHLSCGQDRVPVAVPSASAGTDSRAHLSLHSACGSTRSAKRSVRPSIRSSPLRLCIDACRGDSCHGDGTVGPHGGVL